jgi:hypothetical protein
VAILSARFVTLSGRHGDIPFVMRNPRNTHLADLQSSIRAKAGENSRAKRLSTRHRVVLDSLPLHGGATNAME